MELAINTEFVKGELTFKNAQLKTATQKIVQGMKNARKGFLTAGMELKRIQDEKLYEKDFFDGDGKPSFAMYVEYVLGISKTTAYRIIKTTQQLLAPEMLDDKKPAFFENFSDGALDALTTLGDYDTALNFCNAFEITETTNRDIVREYVKAYKQGYETLADYAENSKNVIDIDEKNVEEETEKTSSEETEEQLEMPEVKNSEVAEMRGYLEFIANFMKSDVNYIFEMCEEKDEEKIIKEIISKFATI